MHIAYVLYRGFTALDLVGPYEVISRWPNAHIHFVASDAGAVETDQGLTVLPTVEAADLPRPDLLLVPGAENVLPALRDRSLIDWIQQASASAQWVVSVCSGAALLAAAGVLEGRRATTHWAFRENLRAMGVHVVTERVVFDDRVVTAAGVSAGIDMALALTARVHGERLARSLQLAIEYDPRPPFDGGSPEKVDSGTLRLAMRMMLGDAPLHRLRSNGRQIIADYGRRILKM